MVRWRPCDAHFCCTKLVHHPRAKNALDSRPQTGLGPGPGSPQPERTAGHRRASPDKNDGLGLIIRERRGGWRPLLRRSAWIRTERVILPVAGGLRTWPLAAPTVPPRGLVMLSLDFGWSHIQEDLYY